ncbi:MAG: hypothetical protein WAU86_19985 [Oricola sp.]
MNNRLKRTLIACALASAGAVGFAVGGWAQTAADGDAFVEPPETGKAKLTLVLFAETGLEDYLPKNCKHRTTLFGRLNKRRERVFAEIENQKDTISATLFGETGRIEVERMPVKLSALIPELKAWMARPDGGDVLIPGSKPQFNLSDYIALLEQFKKEDERVLDPNNDLGGETINKACAYSGKAYESVYIAGAYVKADLLRKLSFHHIGSFVSWYVRVIRKKIAFDRERVVPVYMHYGQVVEPSATKDVVGTLVKFASGTDSKMEVLKTLSKSGVKVSGFMMRNESIPLKPRGERYAEENRDFARKSRTSILMAKYYYDLNSFMETLVHEIGHYVGLPHAFTADEKDNSYLQDCRSALGNFDSFIAAFDGRDLPESKRNANRKRLCDCFFDGIFTKGDFFDYDGREGAVGDTPLAVITRTADGATDDIRYFDACIDLSPDYRKRFNAKRDDARYNVMTYLSKSVNGGKGPRNRITDDQKKVALDVLNSMN